MIDPAPAAARWRTALESWAIPDELVEAAGRSPWGHEVSRFAAKADADLADPEGASYEAAAAAIAAAELSTGRAATLLDVGTGAGAASLPFLDRVAALTAVDPSPTMLAAFAERAHTLTTHRAVQPEVRTVTGRWPDVAEQAGVHDVVVCHHVLFDVADIVPFVQALTASARGRVVVEVPPEHPLAWLSPLFERFHGLKRPDGPTVDDLVAVLHELGIGALSVERWSRLEHGQPEGDERVALVTRRLALPVGREPDVAAALVGLPDGLGLRRVVTLSWAGAAPASTRSTTT